MHQNHEKAIRGLAEQLKQDENFLAVILTGSVGRGTAGEDSDVDCVLVATDEEYQRRKAARQLHYYTTDHCDYEGGYIDGKVLDLAYLQSCAERGSEPARSQFINAQVIYSDIPGLEELVNRIPVYAYSEEERAERILRFMSQLVVWLYFAKEAGKKNDTYLMTAAASNVAFFGGRMILAHNRMLYSCHKWLMRALREAPEKPEGMLEQMEDMLKNPSYEKMHSYWELIYNFTGWGWPKGGWGELITRFLEEKEMHWLENPPPVEDI